MSTIHVLASDGTHAPYDEDEIRHLLAQDLIDPETLFWRPGMEEWLPLSELPPPGHGQPLEPPEPIEPQPSLDESLPQAPLAHEEESHSPEAPLPAEPTHPEPVPLSASHPEPAPVPAAMPQPPPARVYLLNKSMGVATWITLILMGFCALIDLLVLVPFYNELNVLTNGPTTQDAIHQAAETAAGGVLVGLIVRLLAGLPFLFSVLHAACSNTQQWGEGTRFGPGWAVGYYFIPIVCFYRPCQVMQEIWRVSVNPARWKRVPNSILVGVWWTFWLLTCALAILASYATRSAVELVDLINATQIYFVYFTLRSIFDLLTISVVYRIYRRQIQLLKR